jgi:hypothetical protein
MGCGPALAIELTVPLAAKGAYRFDIVADDARVTCSGGTLVDAGAQGCEGAFGWLETEASGALTVVYVDLHPRPRSVTVTLFKDDTPIVVETFEPDYDGREINGAGCGKCYQATVSLDTSEP